MKRWRTDGSRGRRPCCARWRFCCCQRLAALRRSPNPRRRSRASFSREGLERVGDYIRNEIATGKIPGAILLIQQHGKPVYFENFGVRDVATKLPMTRGHDLPALFDVEADHLGRGDDAGRGRQARDSTIPSRNTFRPLPNVKVGVEKRGDDGRPALALEPLQPPDHDRGSAAPHLGHHLRLLRRQRGAQALCARPICSVAISTMPNSPSGSRNCRWPSSRERCGITAIRPTCSAASSRWCRDNRLFQFEKERLLDPLGMTETAFYVADEAKRPRIAEPMPDDRLISPIAGIRDPLLPRRWESGGAGMVGTIGDYARFAQMLLNGGTLRRPALSQARDHRADDVGSYRPGNRNRARLFLFSRRRPAVSASALRCARRHRRTPHGRSANIAGTASPARSSSSTRRTICS